MTLKPTRVEHAYEVEADGGYRFKVVAQYDPEEGWTANVAMASYGYASPEEAVRRLCAPAEAFVRYLKETP